MKKFAILTLLGLGLIFSSCRRDDDDAGPQPLTGIAAFLNGEFAVTRADYNGSLQTALGNVPLAGTGTGTQGGYIFDGRAKTVDYSVQSNITLDVFGQMIPVPINVNGSGAVTFNSETQFVIDDPRYGPMTYNISNKTANSMIATTRFQNDTTIGTVDVLMDLYMEKK